jgi:WD40 repeat protein
VSVRRVPLVILYLLLAGSVLRTSGDTAVWPYAPWLCPERPKTPVPTSFAAPVVLGGDGHTNVTAVAFGLLGERPVAVSAGQEGTLRAWNLPTLSPIGGAVDTGRPLKKITAGRINGQALTVLRDGGDEPTGRLNGRTVRVTADDALHVVDTVSGREVVPEIPLGEDNTVNALELITLNGRLVAVVNDNGGDENDPGPDPLRFWDLATGTRLDGIDGDFTTVRKAQVNGRTVLLTVNGRTARYGPGPAYPAVGTVSIWDPVSREQIALLPGNPPSQGALGGDGAGFSRSTFLKVHLAVGELDGRPVALTGGGDNTVRLWDLTTATQLAASVPPGHTDEIGGIVVGESAGRTVAVTGGWDGKIMLWDLATGRRIGDPLLSPDGPVDNIAITRLRGRPAVATIGARDIQFWDLATGAPAARLPKKATTRIAQFGGRAALLTLEGDRIRLRDLATRAEMGVGVRIGDRIPPSLLTLADLDGRPVLLLNLKRRTRILDVLTGRTVGVVTGVASSEARTAVGRLYCTTVALTPRDRAIHVWDLRTGRELSPPLRGHTKPVIRLLYGRLGDIPIAVSSDATGDIRVWNLIDGKQIGDSLPSPDRLASVALGYVNGHTVVLSAGRDERIRMWDLSVRTAG